MLLTALIWLHLRVASESSYDSISKTNGLSTAFYDRGASPSPASVSHASKLVYIYIYIYIYIFARPNFVDELDEVLDSLCQLQRLGTHDGNVHLQKFWISFATASA